MAKRSRFVLAAFTVPLALRATPEAIAGPFPIGYDSIASYVPLMRDWAAGNIGNQFTPLVGGWLIFALFGTTYTITGVDPVLIVKVAGPLLYGILGLSEYIFARRYLSWSSKNSLILVLIASANFVSLRISWDLMRNILAMTFLFFALAPEKNLKSRVSVLAVSSLTLLAVMTHLLVGGLLLSLILLQAILGVGGRIRQFVVAGPGTVLLASSLILFQTTGVRLISAVNPVAQPMEAYFLAVYLFAPIIPLVAYGGRSFRSNLARNWLLICFIGLVLSTTPISFSPDLVWPERWTFLMVFPLSIYATQGLLRLQKLKLRVSWAGSFLSRSWIMLLLTFASAYIALPASHAFPYYRFVVPTSMLQSTIPVEDSQDVASAFRWLSVNASTDSGVMTTEVTYGWAKEYFTGKATIVWTPFGTTLQEALESMISHGYHKIYTVWWANGEGWYGQSSVPNGFSQVQDFGQFGVFLYPN